MNKRQIPLSWCTEKWHVCGNKVSNIEIINDLINVLNITMRRYGIAK